MRRLCADLLHELERQRPGNPEELFEVLCVRMSHRHGRPLNCQFVNFPPGTVSGLLVVTEAQHLVLVEATVALEHQVLIAAHEFWHLENLGDNVQPLQSAEESGLLNPHVDAETVRNIATRMAARTDYCEHDEAEAELFGSMLASKVCKWITAAWPVDGEQAEEELVNRLELSLGRRTRRSMAHE